MSSNINHEPMIEMFIFETTQQIEQLEKHILNSEKDGGFSREAINDIFRIMHTIKGSSAMMFTIIHNLKELAADISYIPTDIMDNDESAEFIKKNGFTILFKTDLPYDKVYAHLQKTIFLKDMELYQLENDVKEAPETETGKSNISETAKASDNGQNQENAGRSAFSNMNTPFQSMISVGVSKLDKLMDLVGEMVIAEAMVIQNPELEGLELEGFHKAANQLSKITNEIQDLVMSIRMVPLSTTFQRMNRIVRDMSKKLDKEVELKIIGEETEVDKNIIEHISDPLMHLVRNSLMMKRRGAKTGFAGQDSGG